MVRYSPVARALHWSIAVLILFMIVQKVRIEQSAGLSEDDIKNMQREAASHADEDKRKRELAEARNQADSLCWQSEKLIKEHEAKLGDADKEAIKRSVERAREAAKSDDTTRIRSAVSELEQAMHALSRTLYQQTGAGAAPGGAAGAGPAGQQPGGSRPAGGDEDTIDAEFEVKD